MGLVPHHVLITSAAPFADAARYMFGNMAGNIASALSIYCLLRLNLRVGSFCSQKGHVQVLSKACSRKFFSDTNKQDVPMKVLFSPYSDEHCITAYRLTKTSPNSLKSLS